MSLNGAEVNTVREAPAIATVIMALKISVGSCGVIIGCASGSDVLMWIWPRESERREKRGSKVAKRAVKALSARSSATGR
jgi:hypothetical protein